MDRRLQSQQRTKKMMVSVRLSTIRSHENKQETCISVVMIRHVESPALTCMSPVISPIVARNQKMIFKQPIINRPIIDTKPTNIFSSKLEGKVPKLLIGQGLDWRCVYTSSGMLQGKGDSVLCNYSFSLKNACTLVWHDDAFQPARSKH